MKSPSCDDVLKASSYLQHQLLASPLTWTGCTTTAVTAETKIRQDRKKKITWTNLKSKYKTFGCEEVVVRGCTDRLHWGIALGDCTEKIAHTTLSAYHVK